MKKGRPMRKPAWPEQEENDEVGGEEGADDLENAARVHGAHQHAVRRDDQHQEHRLHADGIAAQFRIPLGEDERLAHRPDQVVGHHEGGGLQQQGGYAAPFARLYLRGQREKSLESAQLPPGAHWGKASPRPPGDLSSG